MTYFAYIKNPVLEIYGQDNETNVVQVFKQDRLCERVYQILVLTISVFCHVKMTCAHKTKNIIFECYLFY